ncbi:hypothetical protein LOK49_LG15G01042 [Camellia lanceoleosa]|uniref:Uncharacterized protein n=1 Tax=Camellia lanceoleosa TaxID=1840588 RepID=A0ACC0F361_9ERIC|nr:hypothetical protein LOK49_LG15G01042 [Camellia lanceoleosa]
MLIFIIKLRFCIRSYVVHPLAIRSGRSEDHNRQVLRPQQAGPKTTTGRSEDHNRQVRRPQQSWYQRPQRSISCAQVAMVLSPPGKGHRPRYCYPRARAIRTKGATNTFQKN